MMESLEGSDITDLTQEKIKLLEKCVQDLQESVVTLSESLRDTQRYLIRLAQNQSVTAKHVAQWPYVVVNDSIGSVTGSKKKSKKQDDDYGIN